MEVRQGLLPVRRGDANASEAGRPRFGRPPGRGLGRLGTATGRWRRVGACRPSQGCEPIKNSFGLAGGRGRFAGVVEADGGVLEGSRERPPQGWE